MINVNCPICGHAMRGHPKDWPDWPFCGPRCRLIDLGRWLGESYRLPQAGGPEAPDEDPPKPAVPSAVPDREEA